MDKELNNLSISINVESLAKYYREVRAVDDISFQVKEGSIFGFLGPNGAGKSTTQRILTGIIVPDKGKVEIMGNSIFHEPVKTKELMGVVPEQANVYVDLSAWENLMLMGEIYNLDKKTRQKRASELLSKFGLYKKKDLKAKGFSKGMKQRLLLCMALMNDPQILFLDEPTSGLDIESRHMIRNIIKEYNFQNKTIFLTTHEIEEASQLCDEIAIINHGQLAVIDSPTNLKKSISELKNLEVVFDSKIEPRELKTLPNINEVKKQGEGFILYTSTPGKTIPQLIKLVESKNIEIISLKTGEPSLEEVFLHFLQDENSTNYEYEKEGKG